MGSSPIDDNELLRDHYRFLADLHERLRHEGDPNIVLEETTRRLAIYLGVSRTGYGEFDADATTFYPRGHWTDGSVVSIDDPIPFDAFGPAIVASHRAGELWIHESLDDPKLDASGRETCRALGIVSVITVPVLKDGRLRSLISVQQNSPRNWKPGEIALVTALADRTWATLERVRAEEARDDSEALLAAILRHAPIGIYLKDPSGRYQMVNEAMARMAGRSREDMIGRTSRDLFDAASAAKIETSDRAMLAGGLPQTGETQAPAGATYEHDLTTRFPIETRAGRGIAGFVIDVSERKRADAELARSREALYQSEKMAALGSLLAGVSHELNNPLAIIVAQAELLAREAAATPAADRARRIQRAAERSARIVQTFLAMARQKAPDRRAIDLHELVAGAIELTGYGLRASGVEVRTHFAAGLPPVVGDADQLHQVVVNLIVNAQQAMEGQTERRVLSFTTDAGDPAGTATLDIADTGPGVPDVISRRIFEPFFTTKPEGAGTGVGLSFSQGIVEAHGGTLTLAESKGVGTTFRITLPAASGAQAIDERAVQADAHTVAQRRAALVIDDEPEVADALAEVLDLLGFDAISTYTGSAAQQLIGERRFSLIISDYRMPDLDGMALFEWLRVSHPVAVPAFAFSTGDTLGSAAQRFIAQTARPILEKPFTIAAVRTLIARLEV